MHVHNININETFQNIFNNSLKDSNAIVCFIKKKLYVFCVPLILKTSIRHCNLKSCKKKYLAFDYKILK